MTLMTGIATLEGIRLFFFPRQRRSGIRFHVRGDKIDIATSWG